MAVLDCWLSGNSFEQESNTCAMLYSLAVWYAVTSASDGVLYLHVIKWYCLVLRSGDGYLWSRYRSGVGP